MTTTDASAEVTDPPRPATEPDPTSADPARGRSRWRRLVAMVLVSVLVAGIAGWLVLGWLRPHPYAGTVMQAPNMAPAMDGLIDTDGRPIDIDAFRGDLVLVYFGYTHCPDVCPTTLSQVAQARRRLGDDAARVHVMMVTVDPARDEPALLGDYVRSFDPDFVGVTGELGDIERVATTYGVYFAPTEADEDGNYDMEHTASLLGIDGEGRLRIVWPFTADAEALASDLRELL